jgi:vacuolar-type H+-ATPase subunit C/Vma6
VLCFASCLQSSGSISPGLIQAGTTNKLVEEFNFLRAQAMEPLGQFLDFITYEYMIDNVILLLKGTLNGRDVNELIGQVRRWNGGELLAMESVLNALCLAASCTRLESSTSPSCAAFAPSSRTPRATRTCTRPC